mmetsp:Transcript_25381/g.54584  ORF Transcript_25381/g.54584 Transcript_25381/m.54584 type:complete len:216 (+) Transcript_25381:114-761(+)
MAIAKETGRREGKKRRVKLLVHKPTDKFRHLQMLFRSQKHPTLLAIMIQTPTVELVMKIFRMQTMIEKSPGTTSNEKRWMRNMNYHQIIHIPLRNQIKIIPAKTKSTTQKIGKKKRWSSITNCRHKSFSRIRNNNTNNTIMMITASHNLISNHYNNHNMTIMKYKKKKVMMKIILTARARRMRMRRLHYSLHLQIILILQQILTLNNISKERIGV